jgi:lactate dehydrogenase-like 2-hydroxyacid dehydrogenase
LDQAEVQRLSQAGLAVDLEGEALGVNALLARLEGARYYLYGGVEAADQLTEAQFAELRAKGLALIAFAGKGVTDFLDVPAASRAGIRVSNTPGAVEPSVAEFTVFLTLAALRGGLDRSLRWLATKGFLTLPATPATSAALGVDLADTTIGIVGLGDIGAIVARILRTGFGAKVTYYSRQRKESIERELGMTYLPVEELVATSDLLTLHLANTEGARDLVASLPLESAARNLGLINTASEGLIPAERLASLFASDRLRVAAFDKIYAEDVILASGLAPFIPDRLIVTNHAANATRGAWRRMTGMAVDNILAHAQEGTVPNAVASP